MKRKTESKAWTRPAELSIRFPPGNFEAVVQVLSSRAARLAGFSDGAGKELSRAVADIASQANGKSDLGLRFVFARGTFTISMRSPQGDGPELLRSWEQKRAHRLMDEARLVGDPGAQELLLVKTSA